MNEEYSLPTQLQEQFTNKSGYDCVTITFRVPHHCVEATLNTHSDSDLTAHVSSPAQGVTGSSNTCSIDPLCEE